MNTMQEVLEEYEIDSIAELIYVSYINGQIKQTVEYVKTLFPMSDYSLSDCLDDLQLYYFFNERYIKFLKRILIEIN